MTPRARACLSEAAASGAHMFWDAVFCAAMLSAFVVLWTADGWAWMRARALRALEH